MNNEMGRKQLAHLTRLKLSSFRSWAEADLRMTAEPVVLHGPNGSGKTAILEAVSYLAPGRGLAGAKLGDVVRRPSNGVDTWAVSADIGEVDGPVRIGTGLQRDMAGRERRIFSFEGEAVSPADIAQYIRVLWLTPSMDRLFAESSGVRRRFVDRLAESLHPGHGARIGRYEKAMAERNRLLKDGRQDPVWLEGLERTMAEEGVAIAAVRNQTVSALNCEIETSSGWALPDVFPRARLNLDGEFEQQLLLEPAVRVEQALFERLADARQRDASAGRALDGPHRTNLKAFHIARDCPAELASGGEQKALLIGIVLSHVRLIAADWGRLPILLLDEVCAFLDETRREALIDAVLGLGCQVWLSGTDVDVFRSLAGRATYFDTGAPGAQRGSHFL